MIKIFTANDCTPEFVEVQLASFKKHMLEDFELVLLNCDERISKTPYQCRRIRDICRDLGIQMIEITRDTDIEKDWNRRAAAVYGATYHLFGSDGRFERGVGGDSFNYMFQWSWKHVLTQQQGPICFMHSDVFAIEPIKLTDYLEGFDIASTVNRKSATDNHGELFYLWEALFLANMPLPDDARSIWWWPGVVEGEWTDTGGQTHYWLKSHPEIRVREIEQSGYDDDPALDFHPARYRLMHLDAMERRKACLVCTEDKRMLHAFSGSGWFTDTRLSGGISLTADQSREYHHRKLNWIKRMIGI